MKYFFFAALVVMMYSCAETEVKKQVLRDESHTISLNMDKVAKYNYENDLHSKLSYSIIKEKKGIELSNDSLQRIIKGCIEINPEIGIDSLVDFILAMTSSKLSFTFDKCDSNPELLVKSKKANCVGYAAYFNSLMNYALQQKNFPEKYSCHHYVGKIFYDETNANRLFNNDPFFRDHGFNRIESSVDSESDTKNISVDPGLFEYAGVKRIKTRKDTAI
ncbi:MAG: hypothetical protein ABIQ40_00295 [Bacteroidia bacterium]